VAEYFYKGRPVNSNPDGRSAGDEFSSTDRGKPMTAEDRANNAGRPTQGDGATGVQRRERQVRLERHGLLIFLGQIIGIAVVPLVDDGQRFVPTAFVVTWLTIATTTVWILGYQRLTYFLIVASVGSGLWFQFGLDKLTFFGPPPLLLFLLVKIFCVAVSIRQAFRADVSGTQRIYCGAASFIMIGTVFAAVHLLVHNLGLGHYALPSEFEGGRQIRWVDFIWFSFAILSTAGFSDLVPTGSLALTIATLEGLSGILFPATLIARIASLPTEQAQCAAEGDITSEGA
jgi:hypothetical protein